MNKQLYYIFFLIFLVNISFCVEIYISSGKTYVQDLSISKGSCFSYTIESLDYSVLTVLFMDDINYLKLLSDSPFEYDHSLMVIPIG